MKDCLELLGSEVPLPTLDSACSPHAHPAPTHCWQRQPGHYSEGARRQSRVLGLPRDWQRRFQKLRPCMSQEGN